MDTTSRQLVASGEATHDQQCVSNVFQQSLTVTRGDRERLKGHRGRVVWFTGLSGAGKSTLANALEVALHENGLHTYVLDADNIRQGLNKDLDFSNADRAENVRRIAEVARLMMDAGLIVLVALISPFRRDRELAKGLIGIEDFYEVYVSTSLDICEKRDVKGLYKKARTGQLTNLSGVQSTYEAPDAPALVLDCGQLLLSDAMNILLENLGVNLQGGVMIGG